MLKVMKAECGRVSGLEANGTDIDLAVDIAGIVETIVHTLRCSGGPGGETAFRVALRMVLADDSPVWRGEGEMTGGEAIVTTVKPKRKRKG